MTLSVWRAKLSKYGTFYTHIGQQFYHFIQSDIPTFDRVH